MGHLPRGTDFAHSGKQFYTSSVIEIVFRATRFFNALVYQAIDMLREPGECLALAGDPKKCQNVDSGIEFPRIGLDTFPIGFQGANEISIVRISRPKSKPSIFIDAAKNAKSLGVAAAIALPPINVAIANTTIVCASILLPRISTAPPWIWRTATDMGQLLVDLLRDGHALSPS